MRISELQSKKIISIDNGKNIGNIIDIDVTIDGKVDFLIIEENKNIFSLSRENNTKIFWNDITKIGEDVILVKRNLK